MCGLFHKQGLRSFLYVNDIEYFIGYKNKNMISIDIKMAVDTQFNDILLTLYPNTILIITFFKGFINLKY